MRAVSINFLALPTSKNITQDHATRCSTVYVEDQAKLYPAGLTVVSVCTSTAEDKASVSCYAGTPEKSHMNALLVNPLPSPHPAVFDAFPTENTATKGAPFRFLRFTVSSDPDVARKAHHATRAKWAGLDLRQDFADEAFMREQIKAARLRAPDATEPATVIRLRRLLNRADIGSLEVNASLGTNLCGYLKLNPRLPLWAALALVVEATGRFTQRGAP